MRISRLYVDGYGSLSGFALTLGRGLVVAHGSNEAGKSTILSFIRAVCFGFNKATTIGDKRQSLYDPEVGQKGGWVEFEVDEDGQTTTYRLDRRAIGKGGTLTVTRTPGGQTWTGPAAEDKRAELFHKADDTLFSNIFVIGPDELHALTSVTQKDVESVLFSADAGVTIDLAKEIEQLERARDAIWSPRSREAEFDKISRAVDDTQRQIRELGESLATYDSDRDRIGQIDARVKAILDARRTGEARLRRVDTLKTIRQKVAQREEALAELTRLPKVGEALTAAEAERILQLEADRANSEAASASRMEERRLAELGLAELSFRPDLVERAPRAEKLLVTLTSKADAAARHRRATEKLGRFAARKRPTETEAEKAAALDTSSSQLRQQLASDRRQLAAEEARFNSASAIVISPESVTRAETFLAKAPTTKENALAEQADAASRLAANLAQELHLDGPGPSGLTSARLRAFLDRAHAKQREAEAAAAGAKAICLTIEQRVLAETTLERSLATAGTRLREAKDQHDADQTTFQKEADRLGRNWTKSKVLAAYEDREGLQRAREAVKKLDDAKARNGPVPAAHHPGSGKAAAGLALLLSVLLLALGFLKFVPLWVGMLGAAVSGGAAALAWPRSRKPALTESPAIDIRPLTTAAKTALTSIGIEESLDSQSLTLWIADLERTVSALRQWDRTHEKFERATDEHGELVSEVRASMNRLALRQFVDLVDADAAIKQRLAENVAQERTAEEVRAAVVASAKAITDVENAHARLSASEDELSRLVTEGTEVLRVLGLPKAAKLAAIETAVRRKLTDAAATASQVEELQRSLEKMREDVANRENDLRTQSDELQSLLLAHAATTLLDLKSLAQERREMSALAAEIDDLAEDCAAFDVAYERACAILREVDWDVPDVSDAAAGFRLFTEECARHVGTSREHGKQSRELERLSARAREAQLATDELARTIAAKLQEWQVPHISALTTAAEARRARDGIHTRLREIERDLEFFAGKDTDLREEGTKTGLAALGEEAATLQDRIEQDELERESISREKDVLLPRVSSLENERLTELHARLASQTLSRDELKWKWAQLDTILYLLHETRVAYEREHGPKVLRRAGELLKVVTHGRYSTLEKTGNYEVVRADAKRRIAAPPHLSRATFAQVYLCLRVAYAELGDHAKFPIVWDDTLSDFDEARCEGLFAALQEVARNRQVIIFTHHKHVRDFGEKIGAAIANLEGPAVVESRVLVKQATRE